MATGTYIYITIIEVVQKIHIERTNQNNNVLSLFWEDLLPADLGAKNMINIPCQRNSNYVFSAFSLDPRMTVSMEPGVCSIPCSNGSVIRVQIGYRNTTVVG